MLDLTSQFAFQFEYAGGSDLPAFLTYRGEVLGPDIGFHLGDVLPAG